MARPTSMQVLVDLAEYKGHESARALSLLMNHGAQGEAKLQLLRNYLNEYRARMDEAVREGLDGERLRNYLSFIGRLERAVAEQATEVAGALSEIDRAKRRWNEHERERRTYQTLIDRRRTEASYREARRQQEQLDEIAARSANRKPVR